MEIEEKKKEKIPVKITVLSETKLKLTCKPADPKCIEVWSLQFKLTV